MSAPVGGTAIKDGSQSGNTWSAIQDLPFSFSFFGRSVSQYKVSQNGLVTFWTSTLKLPDGNEHLPENELPLRTISCFWDAFTASAPTGPNDSICIQTFGTAPNRQLWIKWHSFEMGDPTSSYNYFACVLEEGTNNIYMVDMNYHSTANVTATVGLQFNNTHAIQYQNTDLAFGTGSSGYSDNDYYLFEPTAANAGGTPGMSYSRSYTIDSGNPEGLNTSTDNSTSGWTQIKSGNQNTNSWSGRAGDSFPF